MKWIPFLLVALLPSVLLAEVAITSAPATTEVYLSSASKAMGQGDFIAAWALYECALERSPHSQEALAGRLAAWSASDESVSTVAHIVVSN